MIEERSELYAIPGITESRMRDMSQYITTANINGIDLNFLSLTTLVVTMII